MSVCSEQLCCICLATLPVSRLCCCIWPNLSVTVNDPAHGLAACLLLCALQVGCCLPLLSRTVSKSGTSGRWQQQQEHCGSVAGGICMQPHKSGVCSLPKVEPVHCPDVSSNLLVKLHSGQQFMQHSTHHYGRVCTRAAAMRIAASWAGIDDTVVLQSDARHMPASADQAQQCASTRHSWPAALFE